MLSFQWIVLLFTQISGRQSTKWRNRHINYYLTSLCTENRRWHWIWSRTASKCCCSSMSITSIGLNQQKNGRPRSTSTRRRQKCVFMPCVLAKNQNTNSQHTDRWKCVANVTQSSKARHNDDGVVVVRADEQLLIEAQSIANSRPWHRTNHAYHGELVIPFSASFVFVYV